MWKLANIIPIPKPNKDNGTSYRPISLLSVVAKTLEKCLLPYITANITQTPTQHGYKAQHSTVTALHTLNNTVAKGFNQMAPPARTITVALDMSKAFDTVNTHTLIGKLLQTSTPGTILKFVANYIKGRKAYTSFRNHKSIQRQVKTGVAQGGVLSPTLFNIHTADIPTPTAPVQVMLYADDITITSTHTSMSAARKYIQPYLHKVYDWTQHNNLIINPDKTTCTLFTPDPAEYNSNLGLNINNKALPMASHPKVLGLTLDPKLTYNAHIQNIATHAQKPLQVILHTHTPQVSSTEENLPRHTRRTLAQLRTNKSPFLMSYLHKIDASTHPSPLCPLCRTHEHTTQHLFSCPQIPTTLSALDLWRDPSGVAALLDDWREKLAANPHKTTEADSPQ